MAALRELKKKQLGIYNYSPDLDPVGRGYESCIGTGGVRFSVRLLDISYLVDNETIENKSEQEMLIKHSKQSMHPDVQGK